MQLYCATLLHTRATKLRQKIAGVTSVLVTLVWSWSWSYDFDTWPWPSHYEDLPVGCIPKVKFVGQGIHYSHRPKSTYIHAFLLLWPWPCPMTNGEHDLDILKMYSHTKSQVSRSRLSKVKSPNRTDRHTDRQMRLKYNHITTPHSRIIKISLAILESKWNFQWLLNELWERWVRIYRGRAVIICRQQRKWCWSVNVDSFSAASGSRRHHSVARGVR